MKKQKIVVIFLFLLVIALACILILPAILNELRGGQGGVDGNASKVVILLQKNGTDTTIVNGNKSVVKAIPLSELKKVNVPPQMPVSASATKTADYGLTFLKKYMSDLSEKEQDQLISDALTVINGSSKLSKDDQMKIMQKIGTYIIIAENGGNLTQKRY